MMNALKQTDHITKAVCNKTMWVIPDRYWIHKL